MTLQRISEHFVAAAMSIQQSRSLDGVCLIVSGCLAALSDALIRQLATDEPSEMCSHLLGRTLSGRQLGHPGFGISVGSFATQSETIELHTAELSVARTAILDYFQSPAQQLLQKIFSWEEGKFHGIVQLLNISYVLFFQFIEYILRPGKNLIKYFRMVSRDLGVKAVRPQMFLVDGRPMTSHLVYTLFTWTISSIYNHFLFPLDEELSRVSMLSRCCVLVEIFLEHRSQGVSQLQ